MCAGFVGTARADDVDLLSFGNINWNISSSPTTSPPVTIQIQNTAASIDQVFHGYDLGLVFVPTFSTGSSMILNTATNPSTNSVVPWGSNNPVTSVVPSSGWNTVKGLAGVASQDYVVPNTPTNLVTMTFGPGTIPPAAGTWDVYSDYTWSDYFDHTGTVSTNYANNVSSNFLLGTVTVTGAPEPSTLALLGVGAMLGVAGALWRRRRVADQVGI
jgi:hypothetical protein